MVALDSGSQAQLWAQSELCTLGIYSFRMINWGEKGREIVIPRGVSLLEPRLRIVERKSFRSFPERFGSCSNKIPGRFLANTGNGLKLLLRHLQRIHADFHAGYGSGSMPSNNHTRLCFKWNFVFRADQDGVGSNLTTKRDAGFSVNARVSVQFCLVNWEASSSIMAFPVNIVNHLSEWEELLQQGLVNFIPAGCLEPRERLAGNFLESFPFHLPDVDASKQQTFLANLSEQVHVHGVGLLGLPVQSSDKIESRKQLG